jgi:hypothetical protein
MLAVLTLALGVAMALVVSVSISDQAFAATQKDENLIKNLTITSTTIDSQTRVVTVKGKVTFAPEVRRAWVGVQVSQVVGRLHTIRGGAERLLRREAGDPRQMTFRFRFSAYEGRFAPGKATAEAGASTYVRSEDTWDSDYLREEVRLRSSH